MRIRTLAFRILTQIKHDKRTLGLILIAPLFIMTIIYFIFNSSETDLNIGVYDVPDSYIEAFESNDDFNVNVIEYDSIEEGKGGVTDEETVILLTMTDDEKVYIDGSEAAEVNKAISVISSAKMEVNLSKLPEQMQEAMQGDELEVEYLLGQEDGSLFDIFGAGMVGIVIFFLVFLIGGINFLGERTSGTLEKLLSTPIRRIEVVLGYTLGFGILAMVQSLIITLFVVKILGLTVAGSLWLVLLINLLTAVTALSLGMMLSTLANSEFQMVQFIPTVILPQIFLCGIFDLSGAWEVAGHFMPLYYTTHALNEVILKGRAIDYIAVDLTVLLILSVLFITINTLLLKFKKAL